MYHFEYYGYTKAQLEKRVIYGAFEENNYLKVVPDMMDSYKIYKGQEDFVLFAMIKNLIGIQYTARLFSGIIHLIHVRSERKRILCGDAVTVEESYRKNKLK